MSDFQNPRSFMRTENSVYLKRRTLLQLTGLLLLPKCEFDWDEDIPGGRWTWRGGQ